MLSKGTQKCEDMKNRAAKKRKKSGETSRI